MKTFRFDCFIDSGLRMAERWKWDAEVSDEEYDRLQEATDREARFCSYPKVKDIYKRLYPEMVRERSALYLKDRAFFQLIADFLGLEDDSGPNVAKAMDYLTYAIGWRIELPRKWEQPRGT